ALDIAPRAPRPALARVAKQGDAALARAGAPRMSVASYDGAPNGARPSGIARFSSVAPVLRVEHLSMRFGGLVAINDFSFAAWRRHRPDRAQRRRQDDGVQLHHRFLQADRGTHRVAIR